MTMTPEQLNEYIGQSRWDPRDKYFGAMRGPTSRIICADGFAVSVQAGSCSYSTPRENFGPYVQVECGFPTEPVDEWLPFCEDPEKPTDTVYGYVPIHLVTDAINAHGGPSAEWLAEHMPEVSP